MRNFKWDRIRPKVDEAIRAGFTVEEFLELQDLSRKQWYEMKPLGFKWRKIQKELNVEVKRRPKAEAPSVVIVKKPEPKPEPAKKKSKVAVVVCEATDLRSVLEGLI